MKNDFLYQKIIRIISDQIDSSVLLPGDRLPSQRELSRKLRVSIGTVQNAYTHLEDMGLVIPKNRSGYYVRPRPAAQIESNPFRAFGSVPSDITVLETAVCVVRSAARKDLIQLGSAIPNIQGKGVVQLHQALKRHAHKIPNYEADPSGYLPLRRRLARRSYTMGKPLHPDEFVITAGCQESLTLALRCIAGPGDIVAVESPCYYGLLQAMEVMGLKTIEIPASPETGIDIPLLGSILKKWPVKGLVLTPSFSNPSGYLLPDAAKKEIVHLIQKHEIALIEDDVFSDLGYAEAGFSDKRPRTIQSFDSDGRVILCGSISKGLSPDLKMGWMIAGRYSQKARNLKFVSTLGAPLHPQFALAEFLSGSAYERHIRTMKNEYQKKRDILLAAVQKRLPADCRPTQPPGGFLCWLKLPGEIDGYALYRNCLKIGIAVTPGEIFSPARRYKNYIRLNYALASPDQVDSAMKSIGRLIESGAANLVSNGLGSPRNPSVKKH